MRAWPGGAANDIGQRLRVRFHRPQRAATPGQAIVLYSPISEAGGQQVVAAATIEATGPTCYEQGVVEIDISDVCM